MTASNAVAAIQYMEEALLERGYDSETIAKMSAVDQCKLVQTLQQSTLKSTTSSSEEETHHLHTAPDTPPATFYALLTGARARDALTRNCGRATQHAAHHCAQLDE